MLFKKFYYFTKRMERQKNQTVGRPKSFQTTCVIETGLSDFHRMTVSVLKILPPRIISYRDFSNYHNANFTNSLTEILFEGENTESFFCFT